MQHPAWILDKITIWSVYPSKNVPFASGTCQRIMLAQYSNYTLLSYLLLMLSLVSEGQDSWAIDADIARLLIDDDAFAGNPNEGGFYKSNLTGNITSIDNITSYWALPADAPIPESPNSQDFSEIDSFHEVADQADSHETIFNECFRVEVLHHNPMYSFVVCACCSGIFGLLSSAWMIVACSRTNVYNETSFPGRVFALKCKILLGTHIHSTFCVLLYLLLQVVSRGLAAFVKFDDCNQARLCSITASLISLCTSVFWILVGLSNTMLILFLRVYQPGVISAVQQSPSHRNIICLGVLLHLIPWVSAAALNPLQIMFLRKLALDCAAIVDKRNHLPEAITGAAPVLFATIALIARTRTFHSRRLHMPLRTIRPPDYFCRREQCPRLRCSHSIRPLDIFSCSHTIIGIFTTRFVSVLQLLCSLSATVAVCLRVASVAIDERKFLPKMYNFMIFGALGLFYSITIVTLRGQLRGSSVLQSGCNAEMEDYGPWLNTDRQEVAASEPNTEESKLSPRALLEIPKFTRIQFFDTPSDSSRQRPIKTGSEVGDKRPDDIS